MPENTFELVPGRECGTCTACCTHLTIEDPALNKPGGVTCAHCVEGCAIYTTRPPVCRTFFCGWRQIPELGDDWRPDRSGILIRLFRSEDGQDEASFIVTGPLSALGNRNLALVVAGMIAAGVRSILVVPGKPATPPALVLLNPTLSDAVGAKDIAGVTRGLNEAGRLAITILRQAGTSVI